MQAFFCLDCSCFQPPLPEVTHKSEWPASRVIYNSTVSHTHGHSRKFAEAKRRALYGKHAGDNSSSLYIYWLFYVEFHTWHITVYKNKTLQVFWVLTVLSVLFGVYVLQATYRPFLRQILEEAFRPDRHECPDIEYMSGGLTDLLKTGFSMFMKVRHCSQIHARTFVCYGV